MKKFTVKKSAGVTVTLRTLARDFGAGKKGEVALILNPKLYGSQGKNWLGGRTYKDKSAAIAAAKAAGEPNSDMGLAGSNRAPDWPPGDARSRPRLHAHWKRSSCRNAGRP